MSKREMRYFANLDTSDVLCACGASITLANRWDDRDIEKRWFAEHKPHCDTAIQTITDDGMRCLTDDTERRSEWKIGKEAADD